MNRKDFLKLSLLSFVGTFLPKPITNKVNPPPVGPISFGIWYIVGGDMTEPKLTKIKINPADWKVVYGHGDNYKRLFT